MVDWAEVFSYQTVRIVRIRDKRLFFAYAIFLFLIFCYILGWTFGYKKNYLRFEKPQGTIRTSLRNPTSQYALPLDKLPYCGNDVYIGTDWRVFEQMTCKEMDPKSIVYPPSEETAMFITSRLSIINEHMPPNCEAYSPSPNCTWITEGPKSSQYVANLEMYTLFVDHTLSGFVVPILRNSKFMEGTMYDSDGNVVDPCDDYPKDECPEYIAIGKLNRADIMPLKTVLRAAGVSLDSQAQPSIAVGKAKWESHRFSGSVLLFRILYENTHSFNTNNVRYEYHISAIPKTEYKVEEPLIGTEMVDGQLVQSRTIIDRHGLRIIFEQTGLIGKFDFQTLLINAASSLGLIAVATVIVDFLATRVMPQKDFYKACKFSSTIDLENYKDHPELAKAFPDPSMVSPLLKEA